ncbi:MAG: DUF479 domain-containing protein [Gammaproteobacteria bacterium]|nr:DUF479 domain-containing protein [Gammaproteobacteria bacterium]
MNFLAHLWLTERAGLPLAGAVLGDVLRGRIDTLGLPTALAASVALHRRIDAATDNHPTLVRLREGFPHGARRYAGPVLDVVCDHLLARGWPRFHALSLSEFAAYAAARVAVEAPRFAAAGAAAPRTPAFAAWLTGYSEPAGVERALTRLARRARRPLQVAAASAEWRSAAQRLAPDFDALLDALLAVHRAG